MKKLTCKLVGICLVVVLSFNAFSQSKMMAWPGKSKAAKELALSGMNHIMNAESEQAYNDISAALRLDPNFTPALSLMSYLTRGTIRQTYADKAMATAADKTEGIKLFASAANVKNTPEQNREIWTKLNSMYPDDPMIGHFYVTSRATPEERFNAAQAYITKFPEQGAMHNTLAYYYMQDKKDNAMAKQHFEKYISMYPDGANPYDSMGEYYLTIGDMENSKKYYSMAVEKFPYLNSSVNALQKMAESKKTANSTANQ